MNISTAPSSTSPVEWSAAARLDTALQALNTASTSLAGLPLEMPTWHALERSAPGRRELMQASMSIVGATNALLTSPLEDVFRSDPTLNAHVGRASRLVSDAERAIDGLGGPPIARPGMARAQLAEAMRELQLARSLAPRN